jgi:hypothetical protein
MSLAAVSPSMKNTNDWARVMPQISFPSNFANRCDRDRDAPWWSPRQETG